MLNLSDAYILKLLFELCECLKKFDNDKMQYIVLGYFKTFMSCVHMTVILNTNIYKKVNLLLKSLRIISKCLLYEDRLC